MSFIDDIASAAKTIIHSPVTKVVATGIAIVAPPIGAPALGAIVAADKVTDALDKGKAVLKQVQAGGGLHAAIPGGRVPALSAKVAVTAKQAVTAAKVLKATAAEAKHDANAARNFKLLQVVQAAKKGNTQAQALLHQEVKKQVSHILSAGKAPNATPQEQQLARVTTALIKGAAARKVHARKYAVNRHTARVVRVA